MTKKTLVLFIAFFTLSLTNSFAQNAYRGKKICTCKRCSSYYGSSSYNNQSSTYNSSKARRLVKEYSPNVRVKKTRRSVGGIRISEINRSGNYRYRSPKNISTERRTSKMISQAGSYIFND